MLIPIIQGLVAVTLQKAFLQPVRGHLRDSARCLAQPGAACAGGAWKRSVCCRGVKKWEKQREDCKERAVSGPWRSLGTVLGLSAFTENRIKQVPAFPLL